MSEAASIAVAIATFGFGISLFAYPFVYHRLPLAIALMEGGWPGILGVAFTVSAVAVTLMRNSASSALLVGGAGVLVGFLLFSFLKPIGQFAVPLGAVSWVVLLTSAFR